MKEQMKNGMKIVDNMDGEKNAIKKLNIEVADLDKSRIKQLLLLKVDYATKNDYMRSDTIAESIATNIGARAN